MTVDGKLIVTGAEKRTSLLVAAAVSLELGAVTSASSQPVAPFERFGPVEAGCSATHVFGKEARSYKDDVLYYISTLSKN